MVCDFLHRSADHARQDRAVDPAHVEGEYHRLVAHNFGALGRSGRGCVGEGVRRRRDEEGTARTGGGGSHGVRVLRHVEERVDIGVQVEMG